MIITLDVIFSGLSVIVSFLFMFLFKLSLKKIDKVDSNIDKLLNDVQIIKTENAVLSTKIEGITHSVELDHEDLKKIITSIQQDLSLHQKHIIELQEQIKTINKA